MTTRSLRLLNLPPTEHEAFANAHKDAPLKRQVCLLNCRTCLAEFAGLVLTSLLHDELHWLDVPERVTYKMGVMMYRCLHGQAPRYLADHLITSSDVASRLHLRSANGHQLVVPRCRLNTYGCRAFSIAGPTRCLMISEILRMVLTVLSNSLRQSCLVFTNVTNALEVFLNVMRYINRRFTYLLTFLVMNLANCSHTCSSVTPHQAVLKLALIRKVDQ